MRDLVILFVHLIVTVVRLAASTARRPPFRGSRVGARQTSTADPQSRPQACTQPARRGSYYRRFVHSFHAPNTRAPFRHGSEDFYSALSPQRAEKTKVLLVVYAQAQASAWAAGTEERTHRRRRRHETA